MFDTFFPRINFGLTVYNYFDLIFNCPLPNEDVFFRDKLLLFKCSASDVEFFTSIGCDLIHSVSSQAQDSV